MGCRGSPLSPKGFVVSSSPSHSFHLFPLPPPLPLWPAPPRVLAFEPVPHFYAFLEYNVHLNGLAPRVDMRKNVISHESGKTVEMVVPDRGIWGTAGIGGLNIDTSIKGLCVRVKGVCVCGGRPGGQKLRVGWIVWHSFHTPKVPQVTPSHTVLHTLNYTCRAC